MEVQNHSSQTTTLSTTFKQTEKNINERIQANIPKNTVYSKKFVRKVFMNFCNARKYQLDGNQTVEEWSSILKDWAVNMRRKDSTEFKEATVKTMWNLTTEQFSNSQPANMLGDTIEQTYEERKKCIKELRKIMKEDNLLQNLESDDDYLERFLDCTDFDVEKALQRLRMFYELLVECPNWFTQGCPTEKKAVIDKDIRITPKEYDKEGRPLYIVKLANMVYGTMDLVEDVIPVDDFFAETLLSETAAAKLGVCCLIDVENFSWKLMRWLTPSAIRMILRRIETMPVKEYRFHVVNNSFFINTAIKFIWPFIPKYLREKIFFHFNDYDALYQHVDKDVLPVEYGGNNKVDYSEHHAWIYDRNSHIAESFFRNRTMFLETLNGNKDKK